MSLKNNKMDIEQILKENPCWYVVNEDNNTVVNAKILYDNWKVMAWYGDDVEEVPREQLVPLSFPPAPPKNATKS